MGKVRFWLGAVIVSTGLTVCGGAGWGQDKPVDGEALFERAKGTLSHPVAGRIILRFGQKTSIGLKSKGILFAAKPDAAITSAASGSVKHAGPFRSYGNLLIVDAGGGYTILMAGMDKLTVKPGQSIKAGNPIGAMGASGHLYVEFRMDGVAVDPVPWWKKPQRR